MCVKGGIAISSLNQDLARPAIKTVADFLIRDSGRIDLNQSLKALLAQLLTQHDLRHGGTADVSRAHHHDLKHFRAP
jgi:hypothetical protein